DRVESVYDPDLASLAAANHAVSQIFEDVNRVRADDSLPNVGLKTRRLSVQLGTSFTDNQLRYLITATAPTLERLKLVSGKLVDDRMAQPIRRGTDDITRAREALDVAAQRQLSMKAEVAIVNAIGSEALR